jgi:hypothetical protein
MIPIMHFVIGLIQALGRPAFATCELRKLEIIREQKRRFLEENPTWTGVALANREDDQGR